MVSFLVWVVCLAAVAFFIMVNVTRVGVKHNAQPTPTPVDLSTCPLIVADYLAACRQALEAEGFTTVGSFLVEQFGPNLFSLLALSLNRQTGVKVLAPVFYVVSEQGTKITTR